VGDVLKDSNRASYLDLKEKAKRQKREQDFHH
jgi:hypothetical protein